MAAPMPQQGPPPSQSAPPAGAPPEGPSEQAEPGDDQESVTDLIMETGQNLMKLADMLGQSGASEEDQAKMQQIMSLYSDLADKASGGGPQQMPMDVGVQEGMSGVPMGPQTKN